MKVIHNWNLYLETDQVLRGQGGDPAVIRTRNPKLVAVAEAALNLGLPVLEPVVALQQHTVSRVTHNRIDLDTETGLSGDGTIRALAQAESIIAGAVTLGPRLEALAASYMNSDPVLAFALDGLGTAAVDQLLSAACRYIEDRWLPEGFYGSIPFAPGMDGWSVAEGQPQLFSLVDGTEAGIHLTDILMMVPKKSSSFVMGLSRTPFAKGSICEYCSLKLTCKFHGDLDNAR